MEELKDQHRKLTEMIAASKQKVLEDRLNRTRDPPPSTIQHLDEARRTSQAKNMNSTNQDSTNERSSSAMKQAPNVDYFRHIQQKFIEK